METIGDRLKAEREAQGLSQPALAAEAGISKQAISAIERGEAKKPEAATLDPICRRLGITTRWLLTGRPPKRAEGDTDEEWPDIKAYKQAASMGPGAVPDDYTETYKLKFRADSLRRKRLKPDSLGVCYGIGDSMLPRIRSGDAILFDHSDVEPKDGALFVISYDHGLYAKQLLELGGRWFINSLNPGHRAKPEPIDEHKGFKIVGRVRWIGSWED